MQHGRKGAWAVVWIGGAIALAMAPPRHAAAQRPPEASAPAPASGVPVQTQPRDLHGANLDHYPPNHLVRILGKDVRSATGENMGRIVDVLVDTEGHLCAAIIDFGGFLGVGTRKVSIDWQALRFETTDKGIIVVADLTRDQVKAAPEYKDPDKPVAVVTPPKPDAGTLAPVAKP